MVVENAVYCKKFHRGYLTTCIICKKCFLVKPLMLYSSVLIAYIGDILLVTWKTHTKARTFILPNPYIWTVQNQKHYMSTACLMTFTKPCDQRSWTFYCSRLEVCSSPTATWSWNQSIVGDNLLWFLEAKGTTGSTSLQSNHIGLHVIHINKWNFLLATI